MGIKIFLAVFAIVFIAELGDKTRLATLLFAADREAGKWSVFLAASLALVVAAGFVAIGLWTLLSALFKRQGFFSMTGSRDCFALLTMTATSSNPLWREMLTLINKPSAFFASLRS